MTLNPYESPKYPVVPERVSKVSSRPRPMIGRMTAEEVAVVGSIGLILSLLLLPGALSGHPTLQYCFGLSLLVSLAVFLSGIVGVRVRRLTPDPQGPPASEYPAPIPANAEQTPEAMNREERGRGAGGEGGV